MENIMIRSVAFCLCCKSFCYQLFNICSFPFSTMMILSIRADLGHAILDFVLNFPILVAFNTYYFLSFVCKSQIV